MSYSTQDFRDALNDERLAFPDRCAEGFVYGVLVAGLVLLSFIQF